MLAFGSAVAFAQFSRGALLGERDAIVVSLADPDKGPQGGAAQRVEHHALKVEGEPIVRRPSNTPVMQLVL